MVSNSTPTPVSCFKVHCKSPYASYNRGNGNLSHNQKGRSSLSAHSSQVTIRWSIAFVHSLNVFTFDEAFDALLDHVDVGLEAGVELLDDFGQEVLVGELFALPNYAH